MAYVRLITTLVLHFANLSSRKFSLKNAFLTTDRKFGTKLERAQTATAGRMKIAFRRDISETIAGERIELRKRKNGRK